MDKSEFLPEEGMAERFLAFCAAPGRTFAEEVEALLVRFRELAGAMTPVMVRFHLSDLANQAGELRLLLRREGFSGAWSMIGQPPLPYCKIALEAWLTERPLQAVTFLPGETLEGLPLQTGPTGPKCGLPGKAVRLEGRP